MIRAKVEGVDEMKFEKRRSGLFVPVKVGGYFFGKIMRDGKVIDEFAQSNLVTYQGLDSMLSVYLAAGQQVTSWFLGLYSGNYVPVSTDTAQSFPGNATEQTGYSNSTRVPYQVTESQQQATNNASPATFSFVAACTVYGAFLASASAKGSTSGVLFSATQFPTPKNLQANDQLLLTYSCGAATA